MSMNRSISRVLAAAVASAGFVAPVPAFGATLSCTSASFTATSDGNGNINVSCTAAGSTAPPPTNPPPTNPPPTSPPPPGGAIACAGFSATVVIDLPWGAPGSAAPRIVSKGFGHNGIIVARFTTPAASAAGITAQIKAAEWGDQQHFRTAALSTTPCDFMTPNPLGRLATTGGATSGATSPFVTYMVGGSSSMYAVLQPSTTYYFNIKNEAYGASQCAPGESCNMFVELQKPRGL